MKKIFTLVIALGSMTAVFAQHGYDHRNESRDVILGQPGRGVYTNNGGYNNGYYGSREQQIQRINQEYNWKIESVRDDRYLRRAEKKRQIRFLENEKDARIREVVVRYNNRDNRVYDRRY
jgi:hypothetical protein